ncbi:MAG: hypothetical protein AB7E30_09675 [Lawsonibacter sp.]
MKVIGAIRLLPDHVLEVTAEKTGSVIRLNMEPYLDKPRFQGLIEPNTWQTGETDGFMVRWPGVAELSFEEIALRVFDY